MGIANSHLHLMRLKPEFTRHGVGDDGAAALADVLRRGAGDQAAALDRNFDARAGLPDIEPEAAGHSHAAAIAAALCRRALPVFPDVEPQCPIVEPLPIWVGVPSLAQADWIDLHSDRSFIDGLL